MADRTVTTITKIGPWADQYNLLVGDVGDIDLLTTTATDLVTGVNELDAEIGTLSSLTTTIKTSLVNAINEHETEINLKANIASPTFTGTPAAPTATSGTNTTQIATTAFVQGEITSGIAGLATLASPTFTGIPAAPTATLGTNTTQLATTAFVQNALTAGGYGNVLKVGTPVNNQVAVWTGDGTIEGDSALTWTGTTLSISGNTVWHAGNDGATSGLDADLLDGQHGTYYLDYSNFTNLPSPVITLGGDASGSVTLTSLGSGTLTVTIVDDSHNHVIGNVDGLQTALDAKAPLTSPAFLTSATLDGAALATESYVDNELDAQVHDAADITTGTFDTARIPALDASKITTGTFSTTRIPSLDASKITTGTFTTTQIPSLAASKITSGTFADARIAASNVTQHQAALSITTSQISDFGSYQTQDPLLDSIALLTDPNADRILFWDDSAGAMTWLTASTGLSISGTSMSVNSAALSIAWSQLTGIPSPTITLGGDLTGSATLTSLGSATLNATIAANSVALGTDTTGNYIATISGTANQITVSGSGSENAAVTLSLPSTVNLTTLNATTINGRVSASSTTTGTLVAGDANDIVIATGNIAVPASIFTARDAVIIMAGASSRTITRGSGLSMYYNGTNSASLTLAANGMCSVVFESTSKCIVTGNVS